MSTWSVGKQVVLVVVVLEPHDTAGNKGKKTATHMKLLKTHQNDTHMVYMPGHIRDQNNFRFALKLRPIMINYDK